MDTLTRSAPAKINLSLVVTGKREDGFHELETLMVPVSGLADRLLFEPAESFGFVCDQDGVPTDESNLVVKAVRAFERAAGIEVKYQITLEKEVPHGAGLGGGSSDAAFCLLGLNQLHGDPLAFEVLHELAADLGSDVPFFLYEAPCICRGRGDLIEPVEPVGAFSVCLFKPGFGVSTPDAYQRWQSSRELPGIPYAAQSGPYGEMVNDLERPVFEKFIFLADFKRWLLGQAEVAVAQMSGSGSTMIAILKEGATGEDLIARAKAECDPHLFTWSGEVA